MRYQRKSAIAYVFRNFWRLAPFGLVAAALLGIFVNTNAESAFYRAMVEGAVDADNFLDCAISAFTVMRFGKLWWGVLVAVVVFVLTEALLTIKVSGHMHTGEMPLFPVKNALSVAPTMFLFVVSASVLLELLNLAVVGIAFLLRSLGVTAMAVICCLLIYLIRAIMMWLVSMLLIAFPIMFLENYSFNLALSYSARIMAKRRGMLILSAMCYPLCRFILTAVCYAANLTAVSYAVFAVFYLLCLMLIPGLMFRVYYDAMGAERRDISRVMFR